MADGPSPLPSAHQLQHRSPRYVPITSEELIALLCWCKVLHKNDKVRPLINNVSKIAMRCTNRQFALQLLIKTDFLQKILQHHAGGTAVRIIRREFANQRRRPALALCVSQGITNTLSDLTRAHGLGGKVRDRCVNLIVI